MSEFWCPRRAEVGALPGPNGESPVHFPEGDHWREASTSNVMKGARSCSYCGSIHPDDLFKYIEEGGEVGPTDKSYKIYLHRAPDKFYFQHFSDEQRIKFIDLLNQRKIKIGFPGHFYVLPYFVQIKT